MMGRVLSCSVTVTGCVSVGVSVMCVQQTGWVKVNLIYLMPLNVLLLLSLAVEVGPASVWLGLVSRLS